MRWKFTRALVSLLTFALGIGTTYLLRGVRIVSTEPLTLSGTLNANRRVLVDMRGRPRERDMSHEELEAAGDLVAETEQRVLPQVFHGGYLKQNLSECPERSRKMMAASAAQLDWARAEGLFKPRVAMWRGGSFTEAHAGEALYVIDVRECNAKSGPLAYGSTQLAVFRGPALRTSVNTLLGEVVYAVHDIDDDGVDEVLLVATVYNESGSDLVMRLVSLKDGELRIVHDFGVVYTYFGLDYLDRVVVVPLISYTPGRQGGVPEFYADFYRVRCRRDEGCEDWRRLSMYA